MLLFSPPSETQIRQFLACAAESDYTYSEVGATSTLLPPLFAVDHNRQRLGTGLPAWKSAVEALKRWEMFNLSWVRLYWPNTPIARNESVAVLAHCLGCYWLNACRIVYVVEEDGPVKRFGFAYGTLDDHAESGEERFLVEWNRESDEVSYDLLAFPRPHQFLSRVGHPFARRLQQRFAADSKSAMLRAVARADPQTDG
jgi:uncharacterized protein (UPF0548 family)